MHCVWWCAAVEVRKQAASTATSGVDSTARAPSCSDTSNTVRMVPPQVRLSFIAVLNPPLPPSSLSLFARPYTLIRQTDRRQRRQDVPNKVAETFADDEIDRRSNQQTSKLCVKVDCISRIDVGTSPVVICDWTIAYNPIQKQVYRCILSKQDSSHSINQSFIAQDV